METNKLFGLRLKELRKEKGVTLENLAESIGTTKTTLSRYENGTRSPKISILTKLADYFNVDVTWLSGLDVDKEKINITPIFNQLSIDNKKDVFAYAEKKLKEQSLNNLARFPHEKRDSDTEIVDLAAHSEIDGRVYTDEEIRSIRDHLDQFLDD